MDSSNCNSVISVSLPFPSRFAFNRLLPFRFVTVSQRYHFVSLPFRSRFVTVLFPFSHPSKSGRNGDACTVERSFNEDGT